MKNAFLVLTLSFLIAGCSSIGKLIPSKFDNVEFGKLVELNVIASSPLVGEEWCRENDLNRMAFISKQLKVYSEHRLNANISEVYTEIDSLVTELANRESPAPAYCKIKRTNIAKVTTKALDVFGGRK